MDSCIVFVSYCRSVPFCTVFLLWNARHMPAWPVRFILIGKHKNTKIQRYKNTKTLERNIFFFVFVLKSFG